MTRPRSPRQRAAWARQARPRADEIRDIAALDELTPAYEQIAPAPDLRLFTKVSDGDMAALGIDEARRCSPRSPAVRLEHPGAPRRTAGPLNPVRSV
ncbi:hypothetical protein ACIQM3_23780 [Streptomyces sp. NPDC091271]|uniref:hypothetical protein n=1 Tax=Streptomyces sp. NPDC091271 TaxID=3365980 RepID=UPI0038066637